MIPLFGFVLFKLFSHQRRVMNRLPGLLLTSSAFLCRNGVNIAKSSSSLLHSPMTSVFARGFAGEKKKGKKQAPAPAQETVKSDSLIPINIFAGNRLCCHI